MRLTSLPALLLALTLARPLAAAPPGLSFVFVDTEGGTACLVAAPGGESLLIDSGNPGGRDSARIAHAAKDVLKLKRIDHHLITHWHIDHFGGTEELSKLIPLGRFYDHGPTVEPKDFEKEFAWYLKLSEGKRRVLKPGDTFDLKAAGGTARVAIVAGHRKAVAGKGENPIECKDHPAKPDDPSDNAASLGFSLGYRGFNFFHGGDLTWNIEHTLACPESRVRPVDVFLINHHGLNVSNHPALVHALRPRVVVQHCGPRKGCDPEVLETLNASPGLDAMYQLHRNVRIPEDGQAPRERIANWDEECAGAYIRLDVAADGKSYTIQVGDQGKPERHETR